MNKKTTDELNRILVEKGCIKPGTKATPSMSELSRRTGINERTIAKIFNGRGGQCVFRYILYVCAFLEISCSELPIREYEI